MIGPLLLVRPWELQFRVANFNEPAISNEGRKLPNVLLLRGPAGLITITSDHVEVATDHPGHRDRIHNLSKDSYSISSYGQVLSGRRKSRL